MARMFIRGDTHGDFEFLEVFCEQYNTTNDDILVILGDSGILFPRGTRECMLKHYIGVFPITVFCVRGNHEDRPTQRIMETKEFLGGQVYFDWRFPNILYARDGEAYKWNDKSILVIGGAYSVDKYYRLARKWYWNPLEQLDETERNEIYDKINGKKFNYVFTHTCPFTWEPTDLFLGMVDQTTVDNSMERWLEEVSRSIEFDHWYFGHFHAHRPDMFNDGKVSMLFNDIVELT